MKIIIEFLKDKMEFFYLFLGLFFSISALCNWNWMFDPPYHSIKNPIGFFLGRTAMRIEIFFIGIFLSALSLVLLFH